MAQGFLKSGVIWPYGKAVHPARRASEEAVSFSPACPFFKSSVHLGMDFLETRSQVNERLTSESPGDVASELDIFDWIEQLTKPLDRWECWSMGYAMRTIRMTGLFLFMLIFPNGAEPVPRGTPKPFHNHFLAAVTSMPCGGSLAGPL